MKFTLPLPPSVNHLYGFTTRGKFPRRYITPKGQEWYDEAIKLIKKVYRKRTPIDSDCEIWIEAHFTRKRDLDNMLKATLDAFEKAGFIENDYLFYKLDIERHKTKKSEEDRLEIEIFRLEED